MNEQRHKNGLRAAWAGPALVVLCLLTVRVNASEGSFERTLKVSGPLNLDVSTGSGNIEVRTGAPDQVEIVGHIKTTNWFDDNGEEKVKRIEANPPIQQSGNNIRVGHIDDPALRRNVSISYELVVPATTRLLAHTGSGSQRVQGIEGPAEIDTGSGNLQISDIAATVRADTGSGNVTVDHVKGNVRAKTGSGSIHATAIAGGFEGNTGSGSVVFTQTQPGAVRAETGSGNLELQGVRGSLDATTGSGSIQVEGDPTASWRLRTGSGGIRMRVRSDASFDLHAHTSSGSVSVDHPLTVVGSIGNKDIRGKVHGGGVAVEAETGSGNIEIQ
jgi:DUF4097 and DUF4098 domain-containing protein YvlB